MKIDGQEPMSMPHISAINTTFSYKNPAYQSAHPHVNSEVSETVTNSMKIEERSRNEPPVADTIIVREVHPPVRQHKKDYYEVNNIIFFYFVICFCSVGNNYTGIKSKNNGFKNAS